ncbi:hypothetical protein SCP_1204070 [Sparassis crispa]|uniref:Uncharacterized protein n=1 Tax=Sparassis crispa TaxID=139825 RepID=A0A401H163_9APHY|nr:hypothetical protein SCP_1204070 [Sparassis crispa]GBE88176.1 hypothetical protein SCP_1204070 [Sparassis crispa]
MDQSFEIVDTPSATVLSATSAVTASDSLCVSPMLSDDLSLLEPPAAKPSLEKVMTDVPSAVSELSTEPSSANSESESVTSFDMPTPHASTPILPYSFLLSESPLSEEDLDTLMQYEATMTDISEKPCALYDIGVPVVSRTAGVASAKEGENIAPAMLWRRRITSVVIWLCQCVSLMWLMLVALLFVIGMSNEYFDYYYQL